MSKVFIHQLYENMIATAIALLVILLVYGLIDFFFISKEDSKRQKRQRRIRSFYVACVIFLFLMARIWVEGFTHLLAVLGLVSAALVITNKETIMNFVGWLIIMWRALFSEDDLIQVQEYKGYVKSIGMLYFKLSEVSEEASDYITGRVIRVPNGLIANNVLINFSQTSHLLQQQFNIIITHDSNIEEAIKLITLLVHKIILEFYKDKREYSMEYLIKRNRSLNGQIGLKPRILIRPKLQKPAGIELITHYYCFSEDANKIQQLIWLDLIHTLKNQKLVKLAYDL